MNTPPAIVRPWSPSPAQLQALAWIESRNDPRKIGAHGEVTECQVLQKVWWKFSPLHWLDIHATPEYKRVIFTRIMVSNLVSAQVNGYKGRYSDRDLYVMWNLGWPKYKKAHWQFSRAPKVVQRRAIQYAAKVKELSLTPKPNRSILPR